MAIFELEKPDYDDWIATQEHRGDELAAALEYNLTKGLNFTLDDIDWDDDIFKIPDELIEALHEKPHVPTIEDITTRVYGGEGVFDAFMESFHNHLQLEYDSGRITGASYATTWIQLVQTGITQAVNFTLQRDKLRWDLLLAWLQALSLIFQLQTAKVQYAIAKANFHNTRATYALTKMKLATEDATYSNTMENMEAARAQTLDTRLMDGETVVGAIGKQKDLYTQQISSFQRNDENKHVEQLVQMWIAEKTVDEGIEVPDAGINSEISSALENARSNLGI